MVDMIFFELERLGSTIWKEISLWFNLYNPPLQESAGDTQYCSPLFLRGDPTKIQAEIRPKRPFQSTFRQKKATKLPQDHHDDSWPDVLFFFDLWKGPPVPRGKDGGQPRWSQAVPPPDACATARRCWVWLILGGEMVVNVWFDLRYR